MKILLLIFVALTATIAVDNTPHLIKKTSRLTEEEMTSLLQNYNNDAVSLCNANSKANWALQTDLTNDANQIAQAAASAAYALFRKTEWNDNFKDVDLTAYSDPLIKRQLNFLSTIGTAALDDTIYGELIGIQNSMSSTYNTAKICPYDKKECVLNTDGLPLDPNITFIMATSRDYEELQYVWKEWHDKSGKLMPDNYVEYVRINNEAAVLNGYENNGEMWRSRYEDDNLVQKVKDLWLQVEPLYSALHTYVRSKLLEKYGDHMDEKNPNIPAHLLGNMWAQSWGNLYDDIKPFQNASLVDVTAKMHELGYDALRMFKESDDFFQSLGLFSNEMSYNNISMIVKPDDREVACHASAWDFCDGEDFRIKMCTSVDMEDFITVHHEMGHIQYFIQYKDWPLTLRGGANPAFHEAIGDTIALSVATPQHLQKINLLENYADTYEDNINALFSMALERIAFLPFGLLIDMWRWEVFEGLKREDWNNRWWALREEYQKVYAPVVRSADDFDPGAKFHIPANSQYIAYFLAHILEFQMYRSLCIESQQYNPDDTNIKPLHKCDFFESEEAGNKLSAGLALGMSEPWEEALYKMTGERDVSASAILEYFAPLQKFLEEDNKRTETVRMARVLSQYNTEVADVCNRLTTAEWNVVTDVTNEANKDIYEAAVLEYADFVKTQHTNFADVNLDNYIDEDVKRQLQLLSKLGISALHDTDLTELTTIQTKMETIYNTAVICPFNDKECDKKDKPMKLDPDIMEVMASSTNYDELEYVWTEWHAASGALMRTDYKDHMQLVNQAAVLNGFDDYGAMWRSSYEDENLKANVEKMWSDVQPLYDALHTYVKYKLNGIYGSRVNVNEDTIPSHLLGNMWAQSWVNLYERIKPFKDASLVDVTESMKSKNYTPIMMFEKSNEFYTDLGLNDCQMSYLPPSIITAPEDRTIACHASAWDFCDGSDFRIKMCTSVNMVDFVTVHHEMGHIQYYTLYKDLPLTLRGGANPAFHEAVGDLISLSVSTPQHLKKIGLLDDYADSPEDNINALFLMALERVAFLPFGLLIDMWRWDIYTGEVPETEWNKHWWDLREKYQKVSPPNERTEEFFDPGAKFHIPSNYQYIAYFLAHILEFQLHRSLCLEANQYDPNNIEEKPLHKCDIDKSINVGNKLRDGLSLGASKHWSEALKAMTGETEITGEAIVEYFAPLLKFLEIENEKFAASNENDAVDNTIPIVVGSVLGAALLVALGSYAVYYYKNRKNRASEVA